MMSLVLAWRSNLETISRSTWNF